MVGFFELRLDILYFLHGLALALLAGAASGLSHLENRRTWMWMAFFGAFQAGFVWLKAIACDYGDSDWLWVLQIVLLAVSFFCLVQFARRKLFGLGILRLGNWIHAGPAALLTAGIFWLGRDFLKWYIPVLGLFGGFMAAIALVARARGLRRVDFAKRLVRCAYAIGAYASVMGCLALVDSPSSDPTPSLSSIQLGAAGLCTLLAGLAGLSVVLHYAFVHQARLINVRQTWLRKRGVQFGVILLIAGTGWFYADRAHTHKDRSMRDDILLRTRLFAASLPPEHVARLKWDHSDLANPDYLELKQRLMAIGKANPDIRFLMLTGLRNGKAYFLVDSEAPDSPDYSPPGQLYDDAEEDYLVEAHKHHEFMMGPLADRWGLWVSSSVPLGAFGPQRDWIMAEADISATHWQSTLRSARLPPLLITLLFTLIFLTYFYAQDRIHESLARLTLSEQRTGTLVEGSPNCVQMFDLSGICTTINQNGLNALDRRREDVVAQHYLSIWPLHKRKMIKEAFDFTLTGHSTVFESEYERPDGVAIIWRVALTPMLDEQRRVRSLVSIGVDITDLKQTERDLIMSKEAAEAATQAKSEFLAVMSHEIRTPLGGVIGMLNVLRKHQMEPEQQLYLDLAHENAENLLGMLDEILDAAKVEAGKLTIESIPFEPSLEFGRVLEPMRVRAEAKGLQFNWTIATDMPPVLHGDPTRLRQVLANLLSNALKFTETGSISTTISATRTNPGTAVLCIDVTDTGVGVEAEKIGRLFAKFEQADISTTRKFGGTGLGLSIVKSLAELMNGEINVKSTPGAGTTFTFTATTSTGTAAELESLRNTTPPLTNLPHHRAKLRILCAEDDVTNQVAVEFLVKQMGHSIEFVDDGEKAIDWLTCNRPDVVLMDNRMPVMDGFQATKQIRNPATITLDHDIYIIANTANAASGYRERCLAAGMNDYLTKPIRENELHAALERAIQHLAKRGITLPPMDVSMGTQHLFTTPAARVSSPDPDGLSEDELLAIIDEAESQPDTTPQISAEGLRRITEQYHHDAPLRLAEMRQALSASDLVSLARAAHSMKGSSLYVRAETLSQLCAEIEKLADEGNTDSISELISCAETAYAEIRSPQNPSRFPVS